MLARRGNPSVPLLFYQHNSGMSMGPIMEATYAQHSVTIERRISWGAIVAGVAIVLVVQVMLGLLGLGIGLATVDPASNETPSAFTLASASGVWVVITVLLATATGAWTAARLAGGPSQLDGMLHGIIVWATATILAVWLLTSGVAGVVSGAFGALGNSVRAVASTAQSVTPTSLGFLPDNLEQQARALLERGANQAQQAGAEAQQQGQQAADTARQATGQQDLRSALRSIVAGVQQGASQQDRQAAVQMIASQAGISQQEAEQRLSQFQTAYNDAMTKAEQTADQAVSALSGTAFATFVALLLGCVAGAAGGWFGRRDYAY